MKRALLISLVLVIGISANAQNYTYFTEYFDDGATAITGTTANAATTPTPGTIKSGTWITYYSFRAGAGCTPQDPNANPATISPKQLRILARNASTPAGLSTNPNGSNAYLITPTLPNGVNTVSWKNLSTSTSGATSIYTSTNNGATWTFKESVPTINVACSDYSVTINDPLVNRIKFQNESATANQELDNITITSIVPLPVTILSIKAFPQQKGVQIEWNVAGESNVANYVVERAINGRDFSAIATVEAKGLNNYNAFDGAPVGGVNYYRIKAVDKDGSIKTSGVLTVNITKSNAEVVVAPNPVRGSQLNLQISGLSRGTYNVSLYNDLGQVVYTGRVAAETTSLTQSIILPSGVKAGVYNLVFTGGDVKLNKRVVVE